MSKEKRNELIEGYRELARFLDEHPSFPIPQKIVYLFPRSITEFAQLRAMLEPVKEHISDGTYDVYRDFGPVRVSISIKCQNPKQPSVEQIRRTEVIYAGEVPNVQ